MRIDIISIKPKIFRSSLEYSIIKKAINKGFIQIYIHDLKNYGIGKNKKIDDYPYGGGGGMVIKIEPVYNCLSKLISKRYYDEIIFLTPDGNIFSQKYANFLSIKKNIIIICGCYKGVDQRIRDYLISNEISIGKYILSHGETAAIIIIESIIRLIPGVIKNRNSILEDSFQKQSIFISPPVYTRPIKYKGMEVPNVLISGNHKKITEWSKYQTKKLINKKFNKD